MNSNSNTVAIIWLVLVAAFLVTMFIASRGGEKTTDEKTAKPTDQKAGSPEAASAPADNTEKRP